MANILLADDSATMQKVVNVVLSEEGYKVQSANNGEEAVQALSSFSPDLVLAYIKLPGINGYELTKQIKAAGNTPVILLAGAFEPVDPALMAECGADDSLVKPFQTEDLLAAIRKFLPDSGKPAGTAAEEDDIVFDMSGGEDFGAEAEVVQAGAADPFASGGGSGGEAVVEAEVVEAEVVEAEVVESEVVEAAPVMAEAVEAEPVMAEVVEAEVVEAEVVEAAPVMAEVVEAEAVEAEVVEAEVVEAAPVMAAAAPAAAPQVNMPSSDELAAIFMRTAEEKVVEALKGAELRSVIIELLEPHIQKTVSDMLLETMPELIQKLLKEMVEDGLSMLNRELENIMWETVPELAEALIKKEIEKIKAEG